MNWVLAGAIGGALLLGACASPVPPEPRPTVPPAASPTSAPGTPVVAVVAAVPPGPSPASVAVRPIGSPSPATLPLSVLAGRSGADVRVALTLLLQEQVFLTAQATDAASSARLAELGGSLDALDQNSLTIAEIVGAVKGQPAAQAMLDAWRGLVADLIAYAQGQQTSAMADIDRRRPAIAAQLAIGELSPAMADDLLRTRIQGQLALADSIIAHDPTQSTQRLRSVAASGDQLARPIALGIALQAPALASPPTEGLDVDVRLGLTRALHEHTYLTGAALDATAEGRQADQQALLSAVGQNANDIGAQLESVYGPDLGKTVSDHLRGETTALVSAAGGGDRAQAAADLDRLRLELARLLADANQLVPMGLLVQELRASDQPLLVAADGFRARDWPTAYARLREAARQSQKPADALALSIVDRYPGRYLVLPTPAPRP